MDRLERVEKEVEELKKRNLRVEADKAWETSLSRRAVIILATYLSVALYLNAIGVREPWLNAIVPALGFSLSTLTLPFFRSFWSRFLYRGKRSD